MASNYTGNYGLCQWEATDSFVRTEFNQDNARIDAALKDLEDTKAEQAALSSLSATVSGKASQSSVNSLSGGNRPQVPGQGRDLHRERGGQPDHQCGVLPEGGAGGAGGRPPPLQQQLWRPGRSGGDGAPGEPEQQGPAEALRQQLHCLQPERIRGGPQR